MSTEHRRAPKRDVVDISRVGSWGNVLYQHKLSCGHIESRARAATTKTLACAWCLRAEKINVEMKSLSAPEVGLVPKEEQSVTEFDSYVGKLRAGISNKFSIPIDAIDINTIDVNGYLVIKNGVVFLSASDVDRLGKS
jgi:hypothetical protein